MAEGDINVVFDASDEGLTAAVNRFQAELQTLDAQAVATGKSMSEAFAKLNISKERGFQLGSPEDRNNLVQYMASLEQAPSKISNVTGATNELSEATGRAGINFEAMGERLLARLVIFEALHLAVKGVIDTFKESAAFETFQVHFENMARAGTDFAETEKDLQRISRETNQDVGKLGQVLTGLEDAGEGPRKATEEVESLAKRATATGQDITKLGTALEHVKLGETTVPDMIELGKALGTAKDEVFGLIDNYARLTRENKELNDAGAEYLRILKEQTHEMDRQIEEAKRADKERFDAAEQSIHAQQKLNDLRESFLEKVLGAEGKPPGQADPALMRAMQPGSFFHPGGLPETAGGKQMTKDIQLGFQQIYKEENLTTKGMQHFVDTGLIGLRDILAAAKRFHEAEDQARKKAEADRQKAFDDEKKLNDQKLQTATDREGERRRGARVQQDKDWLEINQKIVKGIDDQNNIAKELDKSMGTVAEKFKSVNVSIKESVDNSQRLHSIVVGLVSDYATLAEGVKTATLGGGIFKDIGGFLSNLTGFGDLVKAFKDAQQQATGAGGGAGQLKIKEENSDKIEGHLSTIAGALTGQGTP